MVCRDVAFVAAGFGAAHLVYAAIEARGGGTAREDRIDGPGSRPGRRPGSRPGRRPGSPEDRHGDPDDRDKEPL